MNTKKIEVTEELLLKLLLISPESRKAVAKALSPHVWKKMREWFDRPERWTQRKLAINQKSGKRVNFLEGLYEPEAGEIFSKKSTDWSSEEEKPDCFCLMGYHARVIHEIAKEEILPGLKDVDENQYKYQGAVRDIVEYSQEMISKYLLEYLKKIEANRHDERRFLGISMYIGSVEISIKDGHWMAAVVNFNDNVGWKAIRDFVVWLDDEYGTK